MIIIRTLQGVTNTGYFFDLGNPDHYIMTMSILMIFVTTIDIIGRTALASWRPTMTECSELGMLINLCYEAVGELLPFGFLSVVDIFTPPVVTATSADGFEWQASLMSDHV